MIIIQSHVNGVLNRYKIEMGERMYQYKDLIEIDKRFQTSVNLQLDICDDTKINNYIPTRSSLKILLEYLESILGKRQERATILIGPYGKGKSHLLLVLLRLIAEGNEKVCKTLIKKIEKIDLETANLAKEVVRKKKPFLPVIISGTEEDLNRAFLYDLSEALVRTGHSDLVPDSFCGEAVRAINRWQQDFPEVYEKFCDKLETSSEEFIKRLENMEQKAYQEFCDIYPLLTGGSAFQPMIQGNLLSVYQSINKKLCETRGYGGICIIFDEFSKYIEGHGQDTFSKDMKIIQDFCELANGSKEQQIHIVFVAHKSIKEYGNVLPKEMINAFTGVEGRLKEKLFVVSSQNNYELIQNAIIKKNKDYIKVIEENSLWKNTVEESYKISCFEGLFDKKDYKKIIGQGCFPLLPLTAYLLLAISEKVAQNERSIFTFLANDEQGSLVRLIEEQVLVKGGISADVIYDYFQKLFRENMMTTVHTEWLKANYALSKTEDETEQKIIKVIALLLMLRKQEEIRINEKSICLALGMGELLVKEKIENLCEAQVLVWRTKTGTYAFKNNVGLNLDKEIQETVKKLPEKLNVAEAVGEIAELEYILPKQHNQEYTITRYFRYEYVTGEQFLSLKKSSYLFEEKKADGKIVAILPTENQQLSEIKQKSKELSDDRVVVLCPSMSFGQEENIKKLLAVRKLKEDSDFIESNKVLMQELELYEEDILFEINARIEQLYMPQNGNCTTIYNGEIVDGLENEKAFNRFLSKICSSYYANTPKINNEQINRQNITSQMRRARNAILESILAGDNFDKFEKGTSPEATIFRATMLHTGIMDNGKNTDAGSQYVLDVVDAFIKGCEGKKESFSLLYEKILGKGCGIRKGIIPMFIAKQLVLLEDMPAIYLEDKEVELGVDILNNINENPKAYYLYVEKGTADKESYLNTLEEAFVSDRGKSSSKLQKNRRITDIVGAMHNWYRSLPQCALQFKVCPSDLKDVQYEALLAFRNTFKKLELNPREVLFDRLPMICSTEGAGYQTCVEEVLFIKNYLESYLEKLQTQAVSEVKLCFGAAKKDGLFSILKDWYELQSTRAKASLLSDRVNGVLEYLSNLNTYDESVIVNRLSKIVLDLYVEDWKDTSLEKFIAEVNKIKEEVEALKESVSEEDGLNRILFTDSEGNLVEKFYEADSDDSVSYFLQNAIEEAMEEFGDSLEMNQKVAVLINTLEKLVK